MSIVSITHAVHFSNQEALRRRAAVVAQARVNVHETMGRKNNCKLDLFSMYFIRNIKEIHLAFKNSEKLRTQALTKIFLFSFPISLPGPFHLSESFLL